VPFPVPCLPERVAAVLLRPDRVHASSSSSARGVLRPDPVEPVPRSLPVPGAGTGLPVDRVVVAVRVGHHQRRPVVAVRRRLVEEAGRTCSPFPGSDSACHHREGAAGERIHRRVREAGEPESRRVREGVRIHLPVEVVQIRRRGLPVEEAPGICCCCCWEVVVVGVGNPCSIRSESIRSKVGWFVTQRSETK